MEDRSITICGLPGSGKTTFLAALWHLVTSREVSTALTFDTLRDGNASHLNEIASRWRNAIKQDRTPVGSDRRVSMRLLSREGKHVRLTFPDVSGETFRRMWEERDCDPAMLDMALGGHVLFFIHADTIQEPHWVVDVADLTQKLGIRLEEGQEIPWDPKLAPTQVQLVDLLQLMRRPALDMGPRRLAVVLSAWDKVVDEKLEPEEFLVVKLPLLAQYLYQQADGWIWRVYGLSAQGGEYDSLDQSEQTNAEAQVLRDLDCASDRIRLVSDCRESHDLTEPLVWLIE